MNAGFAKRDDIKAAMMEIGLVVCRRFDRKAGQIAHDISTQRNHGVLGVSAFPDETDPLRAKASAPAR